MIAVIIRSQAEADIAEASAWYEERQIDLGQAFLNEVSIALISAAENPFRFPVFRRRPEVRRILVARFPYRIFFIREPDRLVLFRVLHEAQYDRNWKSSIPSE